MKINKRDARGKERAHSQDASESGVIVFFDNFELINSDLFCDY
jgi:hypothetical protein